MRRICMGGLLFLCAFALLATLSWASDGSGRIVFTKSEYTREGFEEFVSRRDKTIKGWWELHRRNICIINPDGTGLKQLTDDGFSFRPKLSPDGQKIAFCSGASPAMSLYVVDTDGSNKSELIDNQDTIHDFRWSPDATQILAFVRTRRSRDPEEIWTVKVGDEGSAKPMGSSKWASGWNHWAATGSEVLNPNKRLMDGLPKGTDWPEWSPGNRYIAFKFEGQLAIADTTITGMPDRWRPTKLEPPCDRIGDWSPSGGSILFFAGGDVWSINSDGTGLSDLSMSRADDACWSPDESQVAFISTDGRKRNTEIYIMDADGNEQIQLTNTNYYHSDVDWR